MSVALFNCLIQIIGATEHHHHQGFLSLSLSLSLSVAVAVALLLCSVYMLTTVRYIDNSSRTCYHTRAIRPVMKSTRKQYLRFQVRL